MIDDVVQRLHDEDMRELELKMEKKNRTRREMEEFKCAQELWRKREREYLEEEQRKVAREAARTQDNEKERKARWKEKEAAKERVQAYIMNNMKQEQKRKEELQNMLEELAAEEMKQNNDDEEKREIEMELRKRLKMRQDLDEQRYYKMLNLKRQEEEDASYRRQELERLAEMAKLDQLSDAKRRMKRLEHGRAVEAMIEDRRRRRAEEMAQLVESHKQEQDREKIKQRMIEEERIKLLKEHAQNLAGYLPPGLLKPEDKEILGELLVCSTNKN
ncbi:meiosis-specific nuclear structural protein 1-like [Ctenocephalides felis]|uniref:meiosis-specific nuclear structural protein 1-like n=1 Tax=Ctenocephalides felis TaxID=7515 RepID=UPI000E6E2AD7|nr:meiosis-specific nuclear structural protein 1-like [Ctenocephalides felis]